jgi:hypothetical protein
MTVHDSTAGWGVFVVWDNKVGRRRPSPPRLQPRARAEWHHDELFPRVGFVVTNIWKPPADVIHFYNGRGAAEQWIKGGQELAQVDEALQHRANGALCRPLPRNFE